MKLIKITTLIIASLIITSPLLSTPVFADQIVKPNQSSAAKHAVPWERSDNGSGKNVLAPIVNGDQIQYHIDNDNPYAEQIKAALDNWDSLGVIKFVASDADQSYINFETDPSLSMGSHVAAETSLQFDNDKNVIHAKIDINPNPFATLTYYNQTIAIEHEIGHALGFAHDSYFGFDHASNTKVHLVMNKQSAQNNSQISLGKIEQVALIKHYHLPLRKMTHKEIIDNGANHWLAPADQ